MLREAPMDSQKWARASIPHQPAVVNPEEDPVSVNPSLAGTLICLGSPLAEDKPSQAST